MMTSGTSAQADFGDALFGADGTAEPLTEVRPAAVFADPLADPQSPSVSRVLPGPPDPSTRVAEPAPISDEARRLAERQLAARQRGGRQTQQTQQPQKSQKSQQPRRSQQAQPQAAIPYPERLGAPASSPAPVSSPGDPGADRRQLMEQIRAAKGPERKQLIQELLALGRAGRRADRTGDVANRAGPTDAKKSRGGAWISGLVLVVIFLISSGAGRELFEALSDLFSRGN